MPYIELPAGRRVFPWKFLIIVAVAILIGALFFLSTLPKEQPTRQIEVAVPQGGNAH